MSVCELHPEPGPACKLFGRVRGPGRLQVNASQIAQASTEGY